MASTTQYSKIRFIGYAIPTTPADVISIGDPNGPGAVAGTYLGNHNFQTDFQRRIAIMKNAVDLAKNQLPVDGDVINVFVAPEFYFHGTMGPYIYQDDSRDPVDEIKSTLAKTFNATEYPNWTFLFGSVISSKIQNPEVVLSSNAVTTRNSIVQNLSLQWQKSFGPLKGVIFDMLVNFIKVCHSYPNCEVRNRDIIVSNIPISAPEVDKETHLMTTEKYFVSNEDFVLYEPGGKPVITEQMTTYPPIDLSGGDAKKNPFDVHAIFRQNCINPDNPIKTTVTDYGVEICLDHSDTRLRRNIDNEPPVIGGIHVQIIPSCGMQIVQSSVAADANGFVFNCDGQYKLNDNAQGQDEISGVNCLYANYIDETNPSYQAHTQLARVAVPARGGDPNDPASTDATFQQLDAGDITVFDASEGAPLDLNTYFAGGAGQVHIYGKNNPYILYP